VEFRKENLEVDSIQRKEMMADMDAVQR